MSLQESYNEFTWKVYRLVHKKSFWAVSAIACCCIIIVILKIAKADDKMYNEIKENPYITICEQFLSKYPNSEYASEVDSILTDLYIRREEEDFNKLYSYQSIDACERFIKKYPTSEHINEVNEYRFTLEYNKAFNSNNLDQYRAFISKYPDCEQVKIINKKIEEKEKEFYNEYVNVPESFLSKQKLNEYFTLFPNGRYTNQVKIKIGYIEDNEAFSNAKYSDTKYAYEQYLSKYPKGKHASTARAKIKEIEEIEYYKNYSLPNGSQPYSNNYGSNRSYYYGCSVVNVNASPYSDVLVIVRYNNGNGAVAGHLYIRKGYSGTINLTPNNYYQVFFYYGSGWYPKKKMPGGLRGGFLNNESFSKDGSSMYLKRGEEVTYTLTQVKNGNFSTSGSSVNEMF